MLSDEESSGKSSFIKYQQQNLYKKHFTGENNFQGLVYVSTAYANSNRTHSDELLYEKPGSEEDLVAVLKMSDEDAEAETQK